MFQLREPYTPPMLRARARVFVGAMEDSDVKALNDEIKALQKRIDALSTSAAVDDDTQFSLATDYTLFAGGFGWRGWLKEHCTDPVSGEVEDSIWCRVRSGWSDESEEEFRSFQKKNGGFADRYVALKNSVGLDYARGTSEGEMAGDTLGTEDAISRRPRNPDQASDFISASASPSYKSGFGIFPAAYTLAYDKAKRSLPPDESKLKPKPGPGPSTSAASDTTLIALAVIGVLGAGFLAVKFLT